MGAQRQAPAALIPGEDPVTIYRGLDRPQGLSGWVRKISLSPGFDLRTVQAIASRYTVQLIDKPECHTESPVS